MLYKPEGRPSFELLSYIIDSDLSIVAKVLNEQTINQNDIFACGDIKQIYTTKLKKTIEIRRVNLDQNAKQGKKDGQGNQYYTAGNWEDRRSKWNDLELNEYADNLGLVADDPDYANWQIQNNAYNWHPDNNEDVPKLYKWDN